jgi:hypothetical protein
MDRDTRVERRVQPLEKVRVAVKVVEEAAVKVVGEAAVKVVEEAAVKVVEEAASGQLLIWIRILRTPNRYSRSALSSNSIQ